MDKSNILKALGHPLRLQIVTELLTEPMWVGCLQEITGAQQANVSQHLSKLSHAGIVEFERDGQYMLYSICKDIRRTIQTIVEAL